MKNKLKLGQAAGVVAFAIIIGAVSMSSSSTVDARASLKENRTVNAGVALGLTEAADATELLTAGATSALTYYGAELTVAQNDSNVVTDPTNWDAILTDCAAAGKKAGMVLACCNSICTGRTADRRCFTGV